MSDETNVTVSPAELAQVRVENWDLAQKTREEQVADLKEKLLRRIADISLGKDMVDEIYVVDVLADAVSEILNDAKLPEDFPVAEGQDRERLDTDFTVYCKSIDVRPATPEQLAYPVEPDNYDQFIKLVTFGAKKKHFLDWWNQQIGLTKYLQESQIPIFVDYDKLELLFLFMTTMECMAKKQVEQVANTKKIEMATAGQNFGV